MTAPDYLSDDGLLVFLGDALALLRNLADESVDAIVTDPPYAQKVPRDYRRPWAARPAVFPPPLPGGLKEMLAHEPPPGSIITWEKQFPGAYAFLPNYRYVALHVEGKGWYLTGRTQTAQSWAAIRKLVGSSECLLALTWAPLLHEPQHPALESEAERRFWDAHARLTLPELAWLVPQHPVPPYRLDFALPHLMVGVEIDGHAYHSDANTFHNDRVRQRALEAAGWRLVRFSGREACNDPEQCVREAAAFVVRTQGHGA